MLGTNSSEYHALNSGAHRKETIRFTAPALTCHLAFWGFSEPDAGDDAQTAPKRDSLKHALDEAIAAIYAHLSRTADISAVQMFPTSNRDAVLFAGVYVIEPAEPYISRRSTDAVTAEQRYTLNGTYRVIYIACSWRGFQVVLRFELLTEFYTLTIFASATRRSYVGEAKNWYDQLREALADFDDGDEAFKAKCNAIRHYFFDGFWNELKAGLLPSELDRHPSSELFQHVFADFRGVILSNETYSFHYQDPEAGDKLTWGKHAAERLMPLINDSVEKFECTASYMLDGRALYMTTLGPQPFENASSERMPVKYLCYAHQMATRPDGTQQTIINKWQLGRLITRIHLMGTVRLAALRKLDKLYRSGQILGDLEPLIKRAREIITDDDHTMKASDFIRNANTKFNEINKEDAAILYRIERSRYYVQQYHQNIPSLRLQRVEGYQRYDDFVLRRLGTTYDFIERLGRRYERATTNLSLLDQYYLSISANRIGKLGEAVLLVVLVPYYATGLLIHLKDESYGVYGYFIFLLSASIALWKYFDLSSERRKKNNSTRVKRKSIIFATMVIGMVVCAEIVSYGPMADDRPKSMPLHVARATWAHSRVAVDPRSMPLHELIKNSVKNSSECLRTFLVRRTCP